VHITCAAYIQFYGTLLYETPPSRVYFVSTSRGMLCIAWSEQTVCTHMGASPAYKSMTTDIEIIAT
jgi:hypothetical protein